MSASDDIRNFLAPLVPAPGWRLQFGNWRDDSKAVRYSVLKPAGGLPASLVRRPQFTLTLIGAMDDDKQAIEAKADEIIEAMRASSGTLVFLQPAEPVFFPTDDGRPVFEFAVSAITN